jgi:hypothetical protein
MIAILKYWQIILGGIAAIPIIFWLGTLYGARIERIEQQNEQAIQSAKNDVKTIGAITQVRTEYKPVYIEIEKYHEAPVCAAPAVLIDTIGRLPNPSRD